MVTNVDNSAHLCKETHRYNLLSLYDELPGGLVKRFKHAFDDKYNRWTRKKLQDQKIGEKYSPGAESVFWIASFLEISLDRLVNYDSQPSEERMTAEELGLTTS